MHAHVFFHIHILLAYARTHTPSHVPQSRSHAHTIQCSCRDRFLFLLSLVWISLSPVFCCYMRITLSSSHSKLLITVWARHLEKLGYFAFLQLVYMAFLFLCTSVENSASMERQDRNKLKQQINGWLRKGEKQVVTYCVTWTLKVWVLWNTKQKNVRQFGVRYSGMAFCTTVYGQQNSSGLANRTLLKVF